MQQIIGSYSGDNLINLERQMEGRWRSRARLREHLKRQVRALDADDSELMQLESQLIKRHALAD